MIERDRDLRTNHCSNFSNPTNRESLKTVSAQATNNLTQAAIIYLGKTLESFPCKQNILFNQTQKKNIPFNLSGPFFRKIRPRKIKIKTKTSQVKNINEENQLDHNSIILEQIINDRLLTEQHYLRTFTKFHKWVLIGSHQLVSLFLLCKQEKSGNPGCCTAYDEHATSQAFLC